MSRATGSNNGLFRSMDLESVGLIGNFSIVAKLVPLVVGHLLNTISSSTHVLGRSLEGTEVTHKLSRIKIHQFPS